MLSLRFCPSSFPKDLRIRCVGISFECVCIQMKSIRSNECVEIKYIPCIKWAYMLIFRTTSQSFFMRLPMILGWSNFMLRNEFYVLVRLFGVKFGKSKDFNLNLMKKCTDLFKLVLKQSVIFWAHNLNRWVTGIAYITLKKCIANSGQ